MVNLNYLISRFFEPPNFQNNLYKLFTGLKPICVVNMIQSFMNGLIQIGK